jgi:hypothetical protein
MMRMRIRVLPTGALAGTRIVPVHVVNAALPVSEYCSPEAALPKTESWFQSIQTRHWSPEYPMGMVTAMGYDCPCVTVVEIDEKLV